MCEVCMFSSCMRGFSLGTSSLHRPKTWLIGYSKLALGVNARVYGCVIVVLRQTGDLSSVYPAGIGSSNPVTPKGTKTGLEDEWPYTVLIHPMSKTGDLGVEK